MHVDGVLTILLDRSEQRAGVDGSLQGAAADPDARVVVLLVRGDSVVAGVPPESVLAGPTRNPSPEAGVSAAAPTGVIDPGAGGGCRVEPGMTGGGDAAPGLREALIDLPQPVIGMVSGTCDARTVALLDGCDIVFACLDTRFVLAGGEPIDAAEAEHRGLVTLCFPAADLERETEALARELAAKDPLALRFTKQTLRSVGALDWDAVLAFNASKVAELQALRAGKPSPQDLAVQSFLAGKSKPGLGT